MAAASVSVMRQRSRAQLKAHPAKIKKVKRWLTGEFFGRSAEEIFRSLEDVNDAISQTEEEFETLPRHINAVKEKRLLGDLFLSSDVWKAAESLQQQEQIPTPWMPTRALLCSECIAFTVDFPTLDRPQEVVLEDIPLLLIGSVEMGFLARIEGNEDKWTVEIPASQVRNRFSGSELSHRGTFLLQPSKFGNLGEKGLRLTFEFNGLQHSLQGCRPVVCCVYMQQNEAEGTWTYIGQACLSGSEVGAASHVEIQCPTSNKLLRFSILDGSDVSLIPSSKDLKESNYGAVLLGTAEAQTSDILSSPDGVVTIEVRKPQIERGVPEQIHGRMEFQTMTLHLEVIKNEPQYCIVLSTISAGCYLGRRHAIQFVSESVRNEWAENISRAIELAKHNKKKKRGAVLALQRPCKEFYEHENVQLLSGAVVVCNFVFDTVRAELASDADQNLFFTADCVFTAIFTLELCLNIYSNWFRKFFCDGWNLFDMFTVMISLLALFSSIEISALRLFRAFRVMRVVKRIAILKMTLNAIFASLIPLSGALLIMFLFVATFAIIATNSWGDYEPSLQNFSSSLFTLFQIVTKDRWSELVYSLLEDDQVSRFGLFVFFLTFVVVASWGLLNIVLAVMLDEFGRASVMEKINLNASKHSLFPQGQVTLNKELEPLLQELASLCSLEEIEERLDFLWEKMDMNRDGIIQFVEFGFAMRLYNVTFTLSDWAALVEHARDLTSAKSDAFLSRSRSTDAGSPALDRSLHKEEFKTVFRHYLRVYHQLNLVLAAQNCSRADHSIHAIVDSLKMVLLNQAEPGEFGGAVPARHASPGRGHGGAAGHGAAVPADQGHVEGDSEGDVALPDPDQDTDPVRALQQARLKCEVLERHLEEYWRLQLPEIEAKTVAFEREASECKSRLAEQEAAIRELRRKLAQGCCPLPGQA